LAVLGEVLVDTSIDQIGFILADFFYPTWTTTFQPQNAPATFCIDWRKACA
jgi:hypothetical protein